MDAEQVYFFRHSLLRDAAYQLQLPADRARLHALAYSILETLRGALAPNAEAALELADHASLGATHDSALAIAEKDWLVKAAALTEQQSAHDAAAAIWLRLRALATNAPCEFIEAGLRAGTSLLKAGRYKEGEKLLMESGSHPMARLEDKFKAAQQMSALKLLQQRFREAREEIAQLRANYPTLIDPIMDLRLLANEVLAGNSDSQPLGTEQLALKGIAKARELGERQSLLTLRVNLANIYRLNGRARESLPILQEEFDAARQRGETPWIAKIGINLAWTHLALDDIKSARACAGNIAPTLRDAGLSVRHAFEFLLSTIAENEGRNEEALAHLVVALDLVLELGQVRDAANVLHSMVLQCNLAGRRTEGLRWLNQLRNLAESTQDLKVFERYEAARSLACRKSGDYAQAFEASQSALDYARRIKDARSESLHLGNSGLHATVLGLPNAEEILLEASRLSSAGGENYQLAWWELGLAIIAALEGRLAKDRLKRAAQLLAGKFPPARLTRELKSIQEQIAQTSKARGVNLDVLSAELARLVAPGEV